MKGINLRELSQAELESKESDLKEELFNLKFQLVSGQIENPLKVRKVRREIARVKTFLREKILLQEKGKKE